MKKLFLSFTLALACMGAMAQAEKPKYDAALAKSLGADDYGMKMYVLAILKTGTATADKKTTDSLFAGHMTNIGRLADAGKLVIAGPMAKNAMNYRGIFIFDVRTVEEAKQLVASDPAIKGQLLEAELYGWYGSAALPVYLKTHKQIEKQSH